ncbi:MAG: hypothetical protein PHU25_03895 [Deltaproteobacteria bacterium]|nr:hypothetical protein [Deltaproteobacteria bacterium]
MRHAGTLLLAVVALCASCPLVAGELRLGPAVERTHLGQHIVSRELFYDGVPVADRRVVGQVGPFGRVGRVLWDLPDLSDLGSLPAFPSEAQVRAWASARGWSVDEYWGPAIWSGRAVGAAWIVRVVARSQPDGEPMLLYLSARNMVVLHAEPLLHPDTAIGRVFPENPATTPLTADEELTDLDPPGDKLFGAYARVERCFDTKTCDDRKPTAQRDSQGRFFYEPDLEPYTFDDPFAEVNAYHNVTRVSRWMRETFGWNGLFDGHTWIEVRVGLAWYNAAFYSGSKEIPPFIVFGEDTVDFAYDSDVAFHEYGHAINHSLWSHVSLVRDEHGIDMSGAGLEEGLADIWAETFAGDPVMNSYVVLSRTADNRSTCPEWVKSEGHMEAVIVSAFGWDVRERIGAQAWNNVVYRSLPFIPTEATFADFVGTLEQSAADMAGEGAAGVGPEAASIIEEAAVARGLRDPACLDRFVPMSEGETSRVYGYGRKRTGGNDYPFGLQWRVTVPAGAASMHMTFAWRSSSGEEPGYAVHVSRGAPVKVTWTPHDQLKDDNSVPAFAVEADRTWTHAPKSVDFPVIGELPLAPGEELFVLLSSETEASTVIVDATLYFASVLPQPPDAGIDAPDVGPGSTASGWSCSMPSHAARPFSLVSVLLDILLP